MPIKKNYFTEINEQELALTEQDKEFLAQIYVDPKYKSLLKLIDGIQHDLQNKAFRDAEKLEDFLAIRWTRNALHLIKQTIESQYRALSNKQFKAMKQEQTLANLPNIETHDEKLEV